MEYVRRVFYEHTICNEIRRGVEITLPSLGDNTQVLHSDLGIFHKHIMGLCQKHNIHLSREQIGLMNLPNSFNSINMFAWMCEKEIS